MLAELGMSAEAIAQLRQATDVLRKVGPFPQGPLMVALDPLGNVELKLRRWADAEAHFREAVEIASRDNDVHVVVVTGAGRAFCAGYDLEQAAANPDKAAGGQDVTEGPWDPMVDFAMMYRNSQDFASLFTCHKPTIAKVRDKTHWNSANIKPQDPVTLGLCSQGDLNAEVTQAAERRAREGHPVVVAEPVAASAKASASAVRTAL